MSIFLSAIGMDSEYFLVDDKGEFTPVCGLLGGTKKDPTPTETKKGHLQEDNVMAEIGTIPTTTCKLFQDVINDTVLNLEKALDKHKLSLSSAATALFDRNKLIKHSSSQSFGCERDYNCWTRKKNPVVNAEDADNLRTAGGHVHVSLKNVQIDNPTRVALSKKEKAEFVKFMDVTLGLESINLDPDHERRRLYGRAGSFRFTEYKEGTGVEYRVLSNFWTFNDATIRWVFNNVLRSVRLFNHTKGNFTRLDMNAAAIQRAINEHNEKLANVLSQRLQDWEDKYAL
jgi:hypothetical protein